MGRLTADPDVRYTQDGSAVAKYTLAVDRRTKEKEADFIRITAFGKAGEFAEKYLHKGTKMVVSGRIQTGSYKDKDGKTVYTTEVVVDDQEFAESKKADGQSQEEPTDFMNIPEGIEEDLPFNQPTR